MQEANLVLYLFDVAETGPDALQGIVQELKSKAGAYLLVGNKIDAMNEQGVQNRYGIFENILFISARDGLHLDTLKSRMLNTILQKNMQTENVVVTNARHYQALVEVHLALQEVLTGMENKLSSDLLALDIRRCLQFLGEITGEVTNDDQLDYIFSKFCIGK